MVGVEVGVAVSVGVGVGVGVDPDPIGTVNRPLLFDISGSASFPMTPATTLRIPAVRGVTLIATLASPTAGQMTVVDESPAAALAAHPADDPAELNVTAG